LACFCPHEERSIFLQTFDNHLLDCRIRTTARIFVFYLSILLQFLTFVINYSVYLHTAQFYSVIIPTYYTHIDGTYQCWLTSLEWVLVLWADVGWNCMSAF
jgi:hypothetical protein